MTAAVAAAVTAAAVAAVTAAAVAAAATAAAVAAGETTDTTTATTMAASECLTDGRSKTTGTECRGRLAEHSQQTLQGAPPPAPPALLGMSREGAGSEGHLLAGPRGMLARTKAATSQEDTKGDEFTYEVNSRLIVVTLSLHSYRFRQGDDPDRLLDDMRELGLFDASGGRPRSGFASHRS
ncbi:hypothetical protein Msi02_30800 [Microbispora siamensis]|uniref:Uncharacterized protein n=1 Tax=Microbispora siamensis TaxID=564413 RepID=A0ABQ4GLF5_9ACTN|nr:hypothetical protein Msi02_30800 [Microbispora siamensis]